MTAEACVMNKLGIALAADSAVTMSGPKGQKIYQSADKLFLLSFSEPVAVMIYGSASFLGVPWETIIKQYRSNFGNKSFKTVKDHAYSFLKYLDNNQHLFPLKVQKKYINSDISVYYCRFQKGNATF